jgi:hypothetical protein
MRPATLHVQPEVRAVAEHASEDQRGRGSHGPALTIELVDVLALTPKASASTACVRLIAP